MISLFDTHEGGDDFFSSLASTNNNDPFANSTNSSAEVQASSTSPLSNQSQLEQWNTIQSETLSFKDESSHENSFFDTIANAEVVSDTSSFLQQDIKHDVATSPIVTSTISRQETINEKPSKSGKYFSTFIIFLVHYELPLILYFYFCAIAFLIQKNWKAQLKPNLLKKQLSHLALLELKKKVSLINYLNFLKLQLQTCMQLHLLFLVKFLLQLFLHTFHLQLLQ